MRLWRSDSGNGFGCLGSAGTVRMRLRLRLLGSLSSRSIVRYFCGRAIDAVLRRDAEVLPTIAIAAR